VKQISCPHTSLHTLLIELLLLNVNMASGGGTLVTRSASPSPAPTRCTSGADSLFVARASGLVPPAVGRGSGLCSPTAERASGSSSAAPTAERASGSSSAAPAAGRASGSSSAAPTTEVEVFPAWIHRAAGLGSGEVTVLVNPNSIYVFALIECDLCDYD
jgi:hypothetical protein